jgi:outer membrane protein assembly factor BamD
VPEVEQMLREIQEVIAEGEYRVGRFYSIKGSHRAASTRLGALTERYPLYSKADEALFMLGEAYAKMGKNFDDKSARAFSKLVREYPLSGRVKDAKDRLAGMNRPIPDPDPDAVARMQYELDNRGRLGMMGHAFGIFSKRPNVELASKGGKPNLTVAPPVIPEGMPTPAGAGAGGVSAEVGATTITGPSALDTQPDARAKPGAGQAVGPTSDPAGAPATSAVPLESVNPQGSAATPAAAPAAAAPAAESTSKKKKKGRFLGVLPRP